MRADLLISCLLRLRRLFRAQGGASAVEFAIMAPVFLATVLGVVELAGIFLANGLLEASVREASRYGITTRCNESREDRIRTIISENTYGIINMNNVTIETKIYPSFDSIGVPEPFTDINGNGAYNAGEPFTDVNGNGVWDADQGRSGLGSAGEVVLYTLRYNWPLYSPFLSPVLGSGGVMPLRAAIAVRNEPPGSCT